MMGLGNQRTVVPMVGARQHGPQHVGMSSYKRQARSPTWHLFFVAPMPCPLTCNFLNGHNKDRESAFHRNALHSVPAAKARIPHR